MARRVPPPDTAMETSGEIAMEKARLYGAPGGDQNQVLTFVLGDETYGFDILRVQEIRGWSPVTRIPHSPAHVLGVLNLRGAIVPIVDLRRQFMLPRVEYNALTVIIVLSVSNGPKRREVGVVVDGVSDVVDIDVANLRPPPDLGAREATEHMRGLMPIGDRMLVLLDIDRLLTGQINRDTTQGDPARNAA
jgi:purine-binding chemotaxis protein CheW